MRVFYVSLLLLAFGCVSNKTIIETPEEIQKAKKIQDQIDLKQVSVYVNAANPLANQDMARLGLLPAGSSANRILLDGDDFIKIEDNVLNVSLPYYGTQQLPSGYAGTEMSGFRFLNTYDSYIYDYNQKNKVHTLKFRVKNQVEYLTIVLKIYRNGRSNIYINSSHRTAINYDSFVKLEK